MIRKIIHIALIVLIPAGVILLLVSAVNHNSVSPCTNFEVRVDQGNGHAFITTAEISRMVMEKFDTLEGKVISRGKLPQIRQLLLSNPYVERAAVYQTINGELIIDVRQRQPLLRVINANNQSFYIDRAGHLIPHSQAYTARVIVATGHIRAGYSPALQLGSQGDPSSLSDGEKTLRDLYLLVSRLCRDPFWQAFIDQVYVTPRGEFELIPKNGAHTIEFGRLENADEKLDKLMFFYRHGIGQVGWNYYSRINIKYNKQIVCSK
jgi:cell division protein FtsQ